jgi:hypothetical protein
MTRRFLNAEDAEVFAEARKGFVFLCTLCEALRVLCSKKLEAAVSLTQAQFHWDSCADADTF